MILFSQGINFLSFRKILSELSNFMILVDWLRNPFLISQLINEMN